MVGTYPYTPYLNVTYMLWIALKKIIFLWCRIVVWCNNLLSPNFYILGYPLNTDDNNYYSIINSFYQNGVGRGCRNFLIEVLHKLPYHMKMYLKYNLGAFKGMENKFLDFIVAKIQGLQFDQDFMNSVKLHMVARDCTCVVCLTLQYIM